MNLDLTICIPTYNRPELLSACLDSVINSIENCKSDIKILVSDNCSDMNYDKVITEKKKKFSKIKYFRNKKNVRDLNFYLCAKRAKTKYVWIFSDDDIMKQDALFKLESNISNLNNLIVCNYDLYDFKLKKCLKENLINVNNKKNYTNAENVMTDFGFRLSFLSCIILNRNHFLRLPESIFKKYVKYQFPFLLSIYYILYNECNLFFFKESLLIQRANQIHAEKEWWYRIFVDGSSKVFKFLIDTGYSKFSINKARKKLILNDIISDVVFRKLNNEKLGDKSSLLINKYYDLPLHLLFILVIIYTPNLFIKFLYKLFKS